MATSLRYKILWLCQDRKRKWQRGSKLYHWDLAGQRVRDTSMLLKLSSCHVSEIFYPQKENVKLNTMSILIYWLYSDGLVHKYLIVGIIHSRSLLIIAWSRVRDRNRIDGPLTKLFLIIFVRCQLQNRLICFWFSKVRWGIFAWVIITFIGTRPGLHFGETIWYSASRVARMRITCTLWVLGLSRDDQCWLGWYIFLRIFQLPCQ